MIEVIHTCEEMEQFILEKGFVPLFANQIQGFSIEEHTDPAIWFAKDQDGPWEWKGPIARNGKCIYGKFFHNKTGFISLEWAKHFINYRRDGYDFDARYDEGLVRNEDQFIYNTVTSKREMRSKTIKALCNFGKDGNKGFDGIMNRLQMQMYLIVSNFAYEIDKNGDPYGWGVAVYSTPETVLGQPYIDESYNISPEESRQFILDHLKQMYPNESDKAYKQIVG